MKATRLLETLIHKMRQLWIPIPYLWLICFFVIPFIYLLKISLSEVVIGVPPFSHLASWTAPGKMTLHLDFSAYIRLFSELFYIKGFIASLTLSFCATLCCLVLGYGMAYALIQLKPHLRMVGLMLIMVPFSTSFLIRIYAWLILLSQEGMINTWLMKYSLISAPLPLLYTDLSVLIGMVYCYLPFMILPIYTILDKIDRSYLEAAADLGATPLRRFMNITLPLSKPGVIAGCILVFVPVMGEFVIPELLGGPDNLMIGRIMWLEFFNNRDWPLASALAIVLLIIFVVPIALLQRWQSQKS